MRRFVKLMLLLAIFLAGYYVGHLPGSPDIFGQAGDVYRGVVRTSNDISARAQQEDTSLPQAVVWSLFDAIADEPKPKR